VDIEIVDSSAEKRVYLSKRNIKGETRLAITTHAEGDVGVCFRNHLDPGQPANFQFLMRLVDREYLMVSPAGVSYEAAMTANRTIDLDIDIGADAVDYKYASSGLSSDVSQI
jgi:p24 family protein delta-1